MAKRSKADIEQETTSLKDAVAKARKKPLNIAMLMSKEGLAIASDLRKPTGLLRRVAKEAGGQPAKSVQGTLTVSGSKAELISESDDVPGQMAKVAKSWFGEHGIKLTFDIKLPSDAENEAKLQNEEEGTGETNETATDAETHEAAEDDGGLQGEEEGTGDTDEPTTDDEGGNEAAAEDVDVNSDAWKDRRAVLALKDGFADLENDLDDATDIAIKPMLKKLTHLTKTFTDNVETDTKRAKQVLSLLKQTVADTLSSTGPNGGSPADEDGKLSAEFRAKLLDDMEAMAVELEELDLEMEKDEV